MRRFFIGVSVIGLVLSPCPSSARAELPPLIPRKVIFSNPTKTLPEISPDGKRIAYLAPDKNNTNQVWVQTLGADDARQATTSKRGLVQVPDFRRIFRTFYWTYAPDTLLYVEDNDGDENWHIHAIGLQKDSKPRDLTNLPAKHPTRAEIVALHPEFPNEVLVAINADNPLFPDVYRINLTTGKAMLDTKNPGNVLSWKADPKFKVRASVGTTKDGRMEVSYRPDVADAWKTAVQWGADDIDGKVLGFTADGKGLWLVSSDKRDTRAVVRHDLETGKEEVIAVEEGADATDFLFASTQYKVQAVAFNRERVRWKVVDPEIADDFKVLEQAGKGDFSFMNQSRDLQKWIVAYEGDVRPLDFYLYDRKTKKLTHLFESFPELTKYKLAPMKAFTMKSRDGLDMVAYLTLPVGVEAKKLPMVLRVHGGPWETRDKFEFSDETQLLANRGYAVLQVNFRGTSGFGKKFMQASYHEWGGKMQDDHTDAANWAIKEGIADPKRIAIYGESYGGYAAFAGAAFTPDLYVCSVSSVGISNLITHLNSLPPFLESNRKMLMRRIGDPDKEAEFCKARSPLFKADKIKIPLLVIHGANDPRVKRVQSDEMVEALQKAGKPVTYLLFEDEGHGIMKPKNMLKRFTETEAFLAKYLGGRSEPAKKPAP